MKRTSNITAQLVSLLVTTLVLTWACSVEAGKGYVIPQPYVSSIEEQLAHAANSGDLNEVKRLLARGAKVNWTDEEGWTALTWATVSDNIEVVRLLLENGADPNRADHKGYTPLMRAAINGYTDIMEVLADAGANIDAANRNGWTALIEASYRGRAEAVSILLERGANPNYTARRGVTAILVAGSRDHRDVARLLMRKGAQLDKLTVSRLSRTLGQPTVSPYSANDGRPGFRQFRSENPSAVAPVPQGAEFGDFAGVSRLSYDGAHSRPLRGVKDLRKLVRSQGIPLPSADFQSGCAAVTSGRKSERVERAEQLLMQALTIWNQIRSEFPEVADQLVRPAGR